MAKTYRDGSKQIICATKRLFREPGWNAILDDTLDRSVLQRNTALDRLAEEAILRAEDLHLQKVKRYLAHDARLDGDEFAWWENDVVEWTIGQLARVDAVEEKIARENLWRAMRRAKVKVRDYCLSTDMKYFCTFTLDREKVNRYDIKEITQKLNRWLSNQVQRKGIAYVMVPELHKDGAVHFHGMLTEGLDVVDSGTIIPSGEDRPRRPLSLKQAETWLRHGGRKVYNLPGWPYGFTTALQLEGCYEAAVNYVCKYISKGLGGGMDYVPEKVGGRWYYSGGDLGRPEVEFYDSSVDLVRDGFGAAAHEVKLDGSLEDVQMVVIWITAEGVPR